MAKWRYSTKEKFEEAQRKAPPATYPPETRLGAFRVVTGTVRSREGDILSLDPESYVGLLSEPKDEPWCYFAESVTVLLGCRPAEVTKGRPLFVFPPSYNPGVRGTDDA